MKRIFLAVLCLGLSNLLFAQKNEVFVSKYKEDLDTLVNSIELIHPNMFHNLSKEKFERDLTDLNQMFDHDMDLLEFYIKINPLVVEIGDGHTGIFFPRKLLKKDPTIRLFPFPVAVNTDDLSIVSTDDYTQTEDTLPIGSEIKSINGIGSKDIVRKMLTQVNGEKDFYRIDKLKTLFTPLLYALYRTDSFDIDYNYKGKSYTKKVNGIVYSERYERKSQKANSHKEPYELVLNKDENYAFLDFRSFSDLDRFKQFLKNSFEEMERNGISNLIIDVTQNGGGNSVLGDELFQYISQVPFKQFGKTIIKTSDLQKAFYKSEYDMIDVGPNGLVVEEAGALIPLRENSLRFKGHVYLLQSHYTFSSASSFAWAFNYFHMGTIVGEETGGLSVCYGDVVGQTLPNSGFYYIVSHKRFYQYGATDDNIHGVIPDYAVPADQAKAFAIKLIRGGEK